MLMNMGDVPTTLFHHCEITDPALLQLTLVDWILSFPGVSSSCCFTTTPYTKRP